MSFDVDDFLSEFQTRTAEARICTRTDLLDQYEQALRDSQQETLAGKSERITDLEAQIEASERVFHFQSISRREWLGIVAKHQPSKAEQRSGFDFNAETFPPAAIAACSTDPKISPAQAEQLADRLPLAEFSKLWGAVLSCNVEATRSPKAVVDFVAALRNGNSSSTPDREESPEVGSLAGDDEPSPDTTTTTSDS